MEKCDDDTPSASPVCLHSRALPPLGSRGAPSSGSLSAAMLRDPGIATITIGSGSSTSTSRSSSTSATRAPGAIERLVIVTDAWLPQVNGVVRTLRTTAEVLRSMGVDVTVINPQDFNTVPCPTYPSIQLSVLPGERVRERIVSLAPHALHIATEGPLGWAARNFAIELGIPFTTAYHTRFPEYIQARFAWPLDITYGYLRWFHRFSRAIMVPTPMVKRDLEERGFENVRLWSRGVDIETFRPPTEHDRALPLPPLAVAGAGGDSSGKGRGSSGKGPIFLYAGRVAVEKNVEAFLELDLPGTKWVVGDGPALEQLREAYPDAVYWGMQAQSELAKIYQRASVFVFPSKTDTFGLVLLEALATGLPVAAYPVSGPIDVIGDSGVGMLDWDLRKAAIEALSISPQAARAHAERYSWRAASLQMYGNLHLIPPCTFASSVHEWSTARFLDDADLASHLPPELQHHPAAEGGEGGTPGCHLLNYYSPPLNETGSGQWGMVGPVASRDSVASSLSTSFWQQHPSSSVHYVYRPSPWQAGALLLVALLMVAALLRRLRIAISKEPSRAEDDDYSPLRRRAAARVTLPGGTP